MRKKCVGILAVLAGISFLIMGVSCSSAVDGSEQSGNESSKLFMGFENVISISGDTSVEKVSDKIYSLTEDTTIKFSGPINAVLLKTVMAAMQVNDSVNFALDLSDTTGITEWKKDWFEGSESLYAISLPKTVTTIQNASFADCINLKAVTVPCTIEEYPYFSASCIVNFSGSIKEWLESPVINSEELYLNGSQPTSISIPNSITNIKRFAFYKCSKLSSVTIPNSVESIGNSAFEDCTCLRDVTIPNSVENIGISAFRNCIELSSVTISNSVVSIGNSAFENCTGLRDLTIPNSVESIGTSAFEDCTGLKDVKISNGVKSIDAYAFYNCSNLNYVIIPDSLENIGQGAFSNCVNLIRIYYCGSEEEWNKIKKENNYYINGGRIVRIIYNWNSETPVDIPSSVNPPFLESEVPISVEQIELSDGNWICTQFYETESYKYISEYEFTVSNNGNTFACSKVKSTDYSKQQGRIDYFDTFTDEVSLKKYDNNITAFVHVLESIKTDATKSKYMGVLIIEDEMRSLEEKIYFLRQ